MHAFHDFAARFRGWLCVACLQALVFLAPASGASPDDPPVRLKISTNDTAGRPLAPSIGTKTPQSKPSPESPRLSLVEVYSQKHPRVRFDELGQRQEFRHGSWTIYDRQGKTLAQGRYVDGKKNGQWTRWYRLGEGNFFDHAEFDGFQQPFWARATLRDGELDGVWSVFDAEDRRVFQWEFRHGEQHGLSRWWYPDGKKRRFAEYAEGKLEGSLREWNPQGEQTKHQRLSLGRPIVKDVQWHENQKPSIQGWFLLPGEVVETDCDWWSAMVRMKVVAKELTRDPHGVWTWWFPNGQKMSRGEYRNGQQIGHWAWWHSQGQKRAEGVFHDGSPVGVWRTWDAAGQLVASEKFPFDFDSSESSGRTVLARHSEPSDSAVK